MNHLDRLRAALQGASVDGLIVSHPDNVGWLTGFTGTYGRVIVTPKDAVFITDSRYTLQAEEQVSGMPIRWFRSPTDSNEFVAEQVRSIGASRIGFESANTTYAEWERLAQKAAGIEIYPVADLFGPLRMVKDPDEIEKVRQACALADAGFQHVLRMVQPGVTERDIELDLEFYIRRQGAEAAFPFIVVSGERSARPHGHASDKALAPGDFLTLDFGARVDGYNSDITRTVVVGKATERHREVYAAVLEAQVASIEAMRPGVAAKDVDRQSRELLAKHDLAQYFGHGLGHGLGRVVHDTGRMSASSEDVLAPNQVWTVEPGVYIPGFGGVRIEDDVLILDGGVEVLTKSPKELLELP